MKTCQKKRMKRWLAWLLVFCMTVTCMEGIFSLGTWQVSAEGTADEAEQELIDNGDSLLDIIEGEKFNISIYTWDTFTLVATNDASLEVEMQRIPIDTKLLVRFTDIYITDEVEDYVVYSMKLPSALVPTMDESDDINEDTWTELVSGSYVRSYGKIRETVDDGIVSYYFQIYFVNTATQQDIQATFQYGAQVAEDAPEDGEVKADFEMGVSDIGIDVPVKGDFTIEKSAVWKGTSSTVTSSARELVYTITITNNREDAATAGVTATLKEELLDGASYLWYVNDNSIWSDYSHIYGMTVQIDDGEAVEPYRYANTAFQMTDSSNNVLLTVKALESDRLDLSMGRGEMDFDAFSVELSDLVFETLTISYTVWTYYGTVQKQSDTAYTSKTTLTVGEDCYTQQCGANKIRRNPTVQLTMKTYDNVTDARKGINAVKSDGSSGRFGEVARFTTVVTAGGEDWVELVESPLDIASGYSQNYYLDANTYGYINPPYFLMVNLDLESLTTADGREISFNAANKVVGDTTGGGNATGLLPFAVMMSYDYVSYLELETICQKYGISISDLPSYIRYYRYSDPTTGKQEFIWFVVAPETYQLATASMQKNGPAPAAPLFADSSTDSAPAGYRIWVLGLEGKTLKLSYNKFLRSMPTDTDSVMNGSSLMAYNSCSNSGAIAYIFNDIRSYGGMTKTGTLLADGAILWELELDLTAYRELLCSNLSWAYDGGITAMSSRTLTEYLDPTYTLSDRTHRYSEDWEPSAEGVYQSGILYYQDVSTQKWTPSYGGTFTKGTDGAWTQLGPVIVPGFYGISGSVSDYSTYVNIPDTIRFRFISTPTAAADTAANPVANTAVWRMETAYATQVPLFAATDSAVVPLPVLSDKTMDVNEQDASIISSRISADLYTSKDGETVFLNGAYSIADNMSSTTATYTDTATTLNTDKEAVAQTDPEAARYVLLQSLSYSVSLKSGAALTGEIDLNGAYEAGDGQRIYTDSNGAVLTVSDDLNMYDGFLLQISGLTDAVEAVIEYNAAFDYTAYGEAHPEAKRVQLNYSNEVSRDYTLRTNDTAKLKATYNAFSVAVNPDLEKELMGISADGYANTYTIQADIGSKPLYGVYLTDQLTAVSEMAKSGETTAYTPEQVAQLLALMDIESLQITAKNRLDLTYSEEVFRLENKEGQSFGDWLVTEADPSAFGVAVVGEAEPLNGNVFAYRVENKSGSIAAETYFEITYTLRLNTEKVNGRTAFRDLGFYNGGVFLTDNQAVICYSQTDVVNTSSLNRRVMRAAVPQALNWVAAGATVKGAQYLEFPEGVKTSSTTTADTTVTTDWTVTVDINSAGKEQSPVMCFTDGLQISTGLTNDALNQKLLELLFAHMTVQITETVPEGAAVHVFDPVDAIYVSAADAGQSSGYAAASLFELDTTEIAVDYNQVMTVYYTTVIDWKGFTAAVLEEIAGNPLFSEAHFTYDDLKKLTFSYINEVENADRAVSRGSWEYPVDLYGTLGKSVLSTDNADGVITWDIHATVGGGDFSGYTIEDTIAPTASSTTAGKSNNTAALKATELSSFVIKEDGETVYTYTGDFNEAFVDIAGVEGLWDHAVLRFYTEETDTSRTLFELTFDTLKDGADIHLEYQTKLNADSFLGGGGLLASTASIDNGVVAGGGDISLSGSACGSLTPAGAVITKEENTAASLLNESAWTINASVGALAAAELTIQDTLKPAAGLLDYTSLKTIRITLTQDGVNTVLFDSENEDYTLEKFQADGWSLTQKADGTNYVITLQYNAGDELERLPAGSAVTMNYVIAIDMDQYAADAGSSAKQVVSLANSATIIRDGMGKAVSSGSKTDYVYGTEGLTKSGVTVINASGDAASVSWTIDVHLRDYYTQEQLSGLQEIVLTDILPDGLNFTENSLKVSGMNAASYGFSVSTVLTSEAEVETTEDNQIIIKLDLTKQNTGKFTDFRISYSTSPDTSLDAVQNTVKLNIGGNPEDEVTGSAGRCFVRKQSGTVMSVVRPITYRMEAAKLLDGAASDEVFDFRAVEVDENGETLYAEDEDGNIVYDEDGEAVYAYISTASNDTDKASENYGKVIFDEITYNAVGTHYYEIRELIGNDSTIGYDTSVYRVKVEVGIDEINGGYVTETTLVQVIKDGGELDASEYTYEELTFENIRLTELTVEKLWDDAYNQDGKRPGAVEVQLYADGEKYGEPVTLDNGNGWTYTWTALPENKNVDGKVTAIVYSVAEITEVPGYSSSENDADGTWLITNIHTPELVEKTVTKVWEDDDDRDGIRPASVKVYLHADNEQIAEAELSDANDWTVSWNLPKYAEGKEISYSVSEEAVGAYTPVISSSSNEAGAVETFTITNHYTPESTYVTVKKVWEDNGNAAGIRPEEITVQLLADGRNYAEEVILNEENGWTYTWTKLPVNEAGNPIQYSVAELSREDGYLTETGTLDSTNTVTITNTITSVKISKVDLANGEELPGAVIRILDAQGNVIEEWVSANEPHEVTGLKTGEIYTLRETVAPEGYEIASDTIFVLDENGEIDRNATSASVSDEGILLVEDSRIPEETTPEETTPEETTPEETIPEETTPEETAPEETAPEETTPEETIPEETTPSDRETGEAAGEGILGEDGSGNLPITGMLVWPVTFLTVIGIMLMAAGMLDNRRKKKAE